MDPDVSGSLGNIPRGKEIQDRLEVSKSLHAEILSSLVHGRRTASELTEKIYGVTRESEDYRAYYMKVLRATRTLQRHGYVSTRLFGRDKPYKLTPFAAAKVMEIEEGTSGVLPRIDIAVYLLTIGVAIVNIFLASSSPGWLEEPTTMLAYSLLLFLSGYCFSRLAIAVRKVS